MLVSSAECEWAPLLQEVLLRSLCLCVWVLAFLLHLVFFFSDLGLTQWYIFSFSSLPPPLLLPRLWDVPPKSHLWKLKSFLYWSAIQNSFFFFFCIGLENKWWTKILFTKPKYNLSPFSWYYWKTAKLSYLLNDASQWSAKTESQFTLACNFLTDAKKSQGAPFA